MKSPTIVNARSSQPLLLNVLALCFLLFAALAAGAQNNSDGVNPLSETREEFPVCRWR